MDQTYMKEKPVVPLLLSMGIPVIISMIAGALYNIVDSLFVARISEDAMTALSLVFPIQNFSNAIAIGFGIGINAMIAGIATTMCGGDWHVDGEPDSIAGSIFKCLTWNDFNDFRNGGDSVFPADVYER